MSPFFFATFLYGLCLANAINFTTVYEWDKLDFNWPSEANSSKDKIEQNFISKNVHFLNLAVFEKRLFLSLMPYDGIPATLVWLPTSGKSTAPPKLAPFPSLDLHKRDNCDTIQWAKGMDTDTDGRLWALDLGSSDCPSKLWIFDLANNDTTERVHQFPDTVVPHSESKWSLRDVVIDKTPDDFLAYIANIRSGRIVVYSRKTDKSWSVKTKEDRWISLAISPNREARQSLYLIGLIGPNVLYSVSVSELKNEGGSAAVKLIGEWTESPYRMVIDNDNVLYAAFYFQNYLSKWNISEPFREQRFHEVGGGLDGSYPFTFSLDADDTLWVMERNVIGGEARHKLLKAAVGATSHLSSPSTDLSTP